MNKFISASIVALGMAVAAPSQAAISYFTDAAAFAAALNNVTVENFADTTLVPGLSFTSTVGNISGGIFNDQLAAGSQTTTFNFSSAINGLGANFDMSPGGAGVGILWTISLFAGGTEVLSSEVSRNLTGQFFGFISDSAFDSILFTAGTQANGVETYNLDNLSFGTVPEPESLALLGLGLAGIALSRRKQAK
jgi:hypothetical protein